LPPSHLLHERSALSVYNQYMPNAIFIIKPYWYSGTWVFDDAGKGLDKEPFVAGMPEIINRFVKDIPDARKGFRLLFSAAPFPGYQLELIRAREEYGGNWYRLKDGRAEGWLCPALLKYFDVAPERLFACAEPIAENVNQ